MEGLRRILCIPGRRTPHRFTRTDRQSGSSAKTIDISIAPPRPHVQCMMPLGCTKGGCQACNRAAPIRAQDTPRRTRPVGPDPAGPSDRTDGRSHCPGRTAQKMSRWERRGKDRRVSSSRSLSRSLSFLIFVPIIVSIFVDSTSTTRIGTMIKTRRASCKTLFCKWSLQVSGFGFQDESR